MNRTPMLRAAAWLLVGGALAGCAGGTASVAAPAPGGHAAHASHAAPAPAADPANPADVHFMSGMIHHHAQALEMAELARSNGAGPAVLNLAERIHVSQTDEIRMMQNWLRGKGEPVPLVDGSIEGMEGHGHHGGHDLMPGMLTEAQMAELSAARGAEFDRLFLLYMIQHHEGAITMVDELFASYGGGNDDFIYKVATDAFADQGTEIDRMHRMLAAMDETGRP